MLHRLLSHRFVRTLGFVSLLTSLAFSALAEAPARPAPPPQVLPPPKIAPQPAPQVAPGTRPWGKLSIKNGREWELTKASITVGSAATCDVVLTDPTVAPQHFRLTFADGNAAVEDLGSKSGTLVAGAVAKPGKPFKVLNAVEIDPGAVTLSFAFLERGTIGPSQARPVRKVEPKLKVVLPKQTK